MMPRKSTVRFGGAICSVLMVTAAIPAHATKYVIIGAEPDPAPNRSVYIMSGEKAWVFERFVDGFDKVNTDRVPNLAATLDANTIRTVIVYQVFENAGLVSIARAASNDRAGKEEVRTSTEWMRVPDNWMGKAEMIACDWKSWQSARRAWEGGEVSSPKRKKKSQEAASSFASLGMEYLGEANMFNVTDAVDLVWNTRWTDAVQPAYYEGTAAEKSASVAKLAEMQGEIKTSLADAKTRVEAEIKMQNRIDAKLGRIGDKFFREMQGIAGNSEDAVIQRWGIPQALITSTPGVRQLNYYWSDTETIQVPYQVQIWGMSPTGQVPMGERTEYRSETRTIQCYRQLFLKEGGQLSGYRVFDFDVGCS
jgi:hypothetical protein